MFAKVDNASLSPFHMNYYHCVYPWVSMCKKFFHNKFRCNNLHLFQYVAYAYCTLARNFIQRNCTVCVLVRIILQGFFLKRKWATHLLMGVRNCVLVHFKILYCASRSGIKHNFFLLLPGDWLPISLNKSCRMLQTYRKQ